ncbi:helicase-like transcription factor CHR28 [Humulus lupulus]|uniref:helicase-like transcription factor CHR28 n=1 Tax=Humulus lupulus TaxID=3486 RepID=UPI002B414221|nr:helicase-like transcription factor CHR28 [Humulus lupulus]
MLKAGESSNFLMDSSSNGLEQFGFDEDGEYGSMSIDLDTLYDIIDEKGDNDSTEPLQTCSEDSLKSASPGEAVLGAPDNPENTGLETDLMGPGAVHSWYNSGVSNCKIGLSSCSFGSTLYNDLSGNNRVQGSPVNTNSASIKDFISLVPGNGACFTERAGFTLPTSSTTSSFAQRDADNIPDFGKNFDVNTSQGEAETQFMNTVVEIDPQCAFPYPGPKNICVNLCKYGTSGENIETVESPENILHDLYSQDITSNESSICLSNDIMSGYPALQYERGIDDQLFRSCNSQILTTNEELKNHVKDKEFPTESACSSTKMKLNGHLGRIEKYETGVLMNNYLDVEGWNYHYEVEANDYISPMESSFFDANGYHIDEKVPTQPFSSSQSYMYSEERVQDERPQEMLVTSRSIWPPVNVLDEAVSREQSFSADTKMFSKDPKSSFSASSRSLSTKKTEKLMDSKEDMIFASKKLCHPHNFMSSTSSVHTGNLSLNAQGQYMPFVPSFPISNNQSYNVVSQVSKVSPESSHSNFSEKSIVEDDSDICIIEDISHPAPISAPLNRSVAFKNTVVSSHYSTSSDNHVGVGGRVKAKDERVILRLLQDLSQPKSEISPPDGSLAVPLLRHQRIALSWMVQKETDNTHCSGGILADDQGLGKTVSTIALILKEKPPSLCHVKQDEVEPLNLDEDDDVLRGVKQESNALFCMSNETPMRSMKPLVLAKGRPAAGTLIVCPTSVLRQWDDELRNKVTSKASLSVLVYHGSNRTKDPSELAKYDVVLTTYSIVSMEVPKQPRVDEDDEEKGKPKDLVGQKRKNPPGSDKRRSDKKGSDNALLESVARPLAKVGWFRVVLDEAQSIKNHRTQVARACWGLRAKRRWCLSGTPIQNAIDDLYSYFRFLKYDPYDAYKLFCSYIKNPISKNPTNGYKKLQTVLKTIMLRRTKGTLLDGEPIINLPPKHVELKKVEFSKEERDFYSRLEADSRAQFEEYANAGTVKQNYVNILLMLLRLRQACDHPFLVKGVDSHSLWNSSVEMARKLPREEQENLLKCLEVSLAICRICNDPPEDAVVAKCGHVFCNQCLSEQLSGDDPGCPVTNCKARLNASSVFSKATLDSCLRDQSCEDNLAGCSRQEVVETGESCNDGHLYNSSKIKAALDVLKSLCGQQDSSPQNGSALDSSPQNGSALDSSAQIGSALDSSPQIGFALDSSPHNGSVQSTIDGNASSVENSIDTCAVELPKDIHDSQSSDADKGCSTAIKVAGQKAIVFSQWTRMLDLLEACLKDSSIKYRRLDGTMSVTARDKAVKDFNTMPEVTVMIMSLKAASLGLNMVAACHVLLLDLWWNPTTEDQAIDRAHRIGQTRPVTVLRLTVRDTVEDRILALQQKKREMVASAFGEDENGGRQSRLTVEDLKYLFMM